MLVKHLIAILLLVICCLSQQPPTQSSLLTKCQQQCHGQVDCLKHCQNKRQQAIKLVLSISLCFIISFIFCCGTCFVTKHHRFRKFRLLFNSNYKQLAKKYQNTNETIMSSLQFREHLRNFIRIINNSIDHDVFYMNQDGTDRIQRAFVTAESIKPFLYNIQIKGEDQDGKWSASGSIVSTNQGVICWFFKQYDEDLMRRPKDNSGQYAFISHASTLQGVTGKWYLVVQNKKNERSGQWRINKAQKGYIKQVDSNMQILG